MNRFFYLKAVVVLGMFITFLGLPAGQYHAGVHEAYAQERDKESESKGTHTSETMDKAGDAVDKAKEYFGAVMDWAANKLRFFTDAVDSIVGIEGDNKGTNALFGLPIYIFVALVGTFVLKMVYNIVRDSLKSAFAKDEGPPRGRHRRPPARRR
jgi:hypothetical protein